MNKVQAKRLLNVARALRESKTPKSFTMMQYTHAGGTAACGTPGCALGHYAARRDLQKMLKINIVESDIYNPRGRPSTSQLEYVDSGNQAYHNHPKISNHFGLDIGEDALLFDIDGCGGAKTSAQAARFIERFVKGKMSKAKKTKARG